MLETLLTTVASGALDLNLFNQCMESIPASLGTLYTNSLELGRRLNDLVNFKRSQVSFYNLKIREITSLLEESATNRYQRMFTVPLTHFHFFDMSKSNIDLDVEEQAIKIHETSTGYRIPLEKNYMFPYVSYWVENASQLNSGFLEYGSEVQDLFSDYFNYFRYVARSRAKTSFTFVLDISLSDEDVSSFRAYFDNIVHMIDSIEVSYRNSTTQINFKTVHTDLLRSDKEEFFIGDKVSTLRLKITKNSYDKLNLENGLAYFDYYFTIRKIDFYQKKYYHQNVFYTKPLAFGNPEFGLMRNSVKLRTESRVPDESNIRLFYTKSMRGILGNVLEVDPLNIIAVKDGDEIELINHDKVLITSKASVLQTYNSNYVLLNVPVDVTQILNGNISIFRGVNKYQEVDDDDNFYRFWFIYLSSDPVEIDLETYTETVYIDTGLVSDDAVTLGRGFYKFAVKTEDIDEFVTYLKSLSTDVHVAKDRLVFGLPSEVLKTAYPQAFSLVLRPDKKLADIAVSLPGTADMGEKYIIIYDKRKV